ncbi:MAG: NAD(P)H-dependent oxidoreductase [Lachnospiraceae bacterium]|nr:NAD(P)H-dependent oxidoreductase [Lachnospiraceae bacterium]
MNIALINGSPKANNSTSEILLADLKKCITEFNAEKTEIKEIGLHNTVIPQQTLEILKTAEAWVFAYPLYVDSIPAHLLSCLIQLEETDWQNRQIHIYGIVNCGFYEGVQAEFALDILKNWCSKSIFIWGGGIGVGGGGALAQMPTIENGHGPKAPIEKALHTLADKILQQETQQNNFVSVAFPRFLYKMAAQMGWRHMIKANGGKIKDLGNQPR